jgi:hypothetical protein
MAGIWYSDLQDTSSDSDDLKPGRTRLDADNEDNPFKKNQNSLF